MKVKQIKLNSFGPHKDRVFDIPEYGIVVITGANGKGKSSIVEGLSYAVYGKSLRGGKWNGDVHVEIETGSDVPLQVSRSRKAISINGVKFDTKSRGVEALSEQPLPEWDVWKRTAVLSNDSAAVFAGATNSERTRLLESCCGISRFDMGVQSIRSDKSEAEKALAIARGQMTILMSVVGGLKDDIANMEKVKEPTGNLDHMEKSLAAIHDHKHLVREQCSKHREQIAKLEAQIFEMRRRIKAVESGKCETCGAPYTTVDKMILDVGLLEHQVSTTKRLLETDKLRIEDYMVQARPIEEQIQEYKQELAKFQLTENRYVKAKVKLAQHEMGEMRDLDMTIKQAEYTVEKLDKCLKVLGPKGARTLVLEKALKGLALLSNKWLSILSDGRMGLTISPTRTKKTGGEANEINIQITGLETSDYASASGGERRRIDIALLLALSEVTAKLSGLSSTTLFLDEVFDSVDTEGIDGVVRVIKELAKSRGLVIITHNPKLAALLPEAKRIEL